MRISVEFDSMEEFEAFRVSGKKSRSKKEEDMPAVEETAQAIRDAQPLTPQPPAVTPGPPPQGFPGGNGQMPQPVMVHPLVSAILARIDGAMTSGQSSDAIVTWFRQQIGPEAVNATLEQIKQIYVPRMTEAQLKQIAPQLGIQG